MTDNLEVNKKLLKQGNDAIGIGDYEGFLSLCTEDTEWNLLGDTILNGKEAVRLWMSETYANPPQVTVDDLIAEGNFLVAKGIVSMTNKQGVKTESSYCDVWQIRDGKFSGLQAYVITQKILRSSL